MKNTTQEDQQQQMLKQLEAMVEEKEQARVARADRIEKALRHLLEPDQVVELRVLDVVNGPGRPYTVAGFFDYDHLPDLAKKAASFDGRFTKAQGVYFTLNPLTPDLLARSNNRADRAEQGTQATDRDVLRRRLLLIDADPKRIAKVSSTDDEKAKARTVIEAVRSFLHEQGWPEPVLADSGNGYHLLYRIDLPTDDGGLVKRVLAGLAERFDTEAVKIDRSVFNPARICKLYGTRACKGDDTPSRPHRESGLLEVPEELRTVPREMLEQVAALADAKGDGPTEATRAHAKARSMRKQRGSTALDRARVYLAKVPGAVSGEEGHNRTFNVACKLILGFDLTVEEALPLMQEWNQKCQPPWEEHELRHKLDDANLKDGRRGYLLEDEDEHSSGRTNAATRLVALVEESGAELFQDPRGVPYASLEIDGHRETWPLYSQTFRDWLARRAYHDQGGIPGRQAVDDAVSVLTGKAKYDGGPMREVHVRTAALGERIYLDLGDPTWRAVEIDADGWRVVDRPPVYFRRTGGMLPLPEPQQGGSLADLRRLLNVGDGDSFRLIVAWLLGTLHPTGPYPVLLLYGEQGSAKSTTARGLRYLVDPHKVPLRSPVRDEGVLAIAAQNNRIVAFDNLSNISPDLSDALCRLATGSGLGNRKLYSDDDEALFAAARPVLLNGIAAEMADRPDLLDRALVVELPPITDDRRRTEEDVWRELEAARPRLLGGLLDAVSAGLRNLPEVKFARLPRMADFVKWVEACGKALGWKRGAFVKAYDEMREAADQQTLSNWTLLPFLLKLAGEKSGFRGTMGQLFAKVNYLRHVEGQRAPADWPQTPKGLGSQLRRHLPALRRIGMAVELTGKSRRGSEVRITKSKPRTEDAA